ncbi:MAG: hypothetical protein GXO43_07935 [Crenarchaeota archaeon]|nr:hypothetical protein [Thermoproteota archaeon]
MKIIVIGNPTIDNIYVNGRFTKRCVGGGIYYTIEAINEVYGQRYRTKLVSIISPYQYTWIYKLYRIGVEIKAYPDTRTNIFILKYKGGRRTIGLIEKSSPLIFSLTDSYDVAIINPVMGEILPQQLKIVKTRARLIAIDIQGFIRRSINTSIKYFKPPYLEELFRLSNIVHMNDDEAEYITGTRNIEHQVKRLVRLSPGTIFLVSSPTHVAMGTNSLYEYIEVPDIRYSDTTGAGDYLLTIFSIELYSSNDPMIALARAVKYTQKWLEKKNASSRPATP